MSAPMAGLFMLIAVITALLVLGILIFGVVTFARGGDFNRKYSNKIMRARLLFQFIAVILVLIAVGLAQAG